MSNAAPPLELADPTEPVRGRTGQAVDFARHHARTIGLALWGVAGAVFALHAAGAAMPDPTRFAIFESWIIGLGCVGCPLMALRAFARRINLQVFGAVAMFCVALSLLLTVLILGGALHFGTLDATFALILPEAAAIQAVNAADAEVHARRREDAAYQRGRDDAVLGMLDQRHAALAGLGRLDAMTAAELEAFIGIAEGELAAKLYGQPPLRLASVTAISESPNGRGAVAGWATRGHGTN